MVIYNGGFTIKNMVLPVLHGVLMGLTYGKHGVTMKHRVLTV